MNDIALELDKLHTLKGADYSRQVERIARMGVFHPIEGELGIYSVGGESSDDYGNLLNAARKAVAHGYKVYILPNPSVTCSPDFIFERKGVFRLIEMKTIQGSSSASNRLSDSTSQSNHVLLIFKGKNVISIKRRFVFQKDFVRKFRKEFGK